MNKSTKLILSAIGISAIIIPAVLLIIFTSRGQKEPSIPQGSRQINPQTVEEAVDKYPKPIVESPPPSTPSAQPVFESSPSSR